MLPVAQACAGCWVQETDGFTSEEEQGGDPPRLWAPGAAWPGTAFTRSIGDSGTPPHTPQHPSKAPAEHGRQAALQALLWRSAL